MYQYYDGSGRMQVIDLGNREMELRDLEERGLYLSSAVYDTQDDAGNMKHFRALCGDGEYALTYDEDEQLVRIYKPLWSKEQSSLKTQALRAIEVA